MLFCFFRGGHQLTTTWHDGMGGCCGGTKPHLGFKVSPCLEATPASGHCWLAGCRAWRPWRRRQSALAAVTAAEAEAGARDEGLPPCLRSPPSSSHDMVSYWYVLLSVFRPKNARFQLVDACARADKEKGLVMLSFMSLIGLGLMILLLFRWVNGFSCF
jgi:hypothetical protein